MKATILKNISNLTIHGNSVLIFWKNRSNRIAILCKMKFEKQSVTMYTKLCHIETSFIKKLVGHKYEKYLTTEIKHQLDTMLNNHHHFPLVKHYFKNLSTQT